MNRFRSFSSRTAGLIALGMAASAVAPMVMVAPATAQTFSDTRTHWARPFIETLASQRIINGYPDGSFGPDRPVTRAEFAAMLQASFNEREIRTIGRFNDVPARHWASAAIDRAYNTGFMSGYPNNQFRPEERIPRVQALVSLASGLRLQSTTTPQNVLGIYRDANQIPNYALNQVAAATENRMVVNYPNVSDLEPNAVATRAEVAAFIHQALVNRGRLNPIASNSDVARFVVGGVNPTTGTGTPIGQNPINQNPINQNPVNQNLMIPRGTLINVLYPNSSRVVVTPGETLNITLEVANNITNAQNQVLIPRNSQIQGQLIPRYSGSQFLGTQFVAQNLIVGNRSYNNINATSQLVGAQAPTAVNQGSVQNAVISTAAQVLLGRVLGGNINPVDIIAGVLTGTPAQTTPQQQQQLIIIEPQQDLRLTVGSDFFVNQVNFN